MSALEMIKLKNGSEEPKASVITVMMSLEGLVETGLGGMLAIYDLRQIAMGTGAKISPETIKLLQDFALLQPDGSPHDTIRNIVLSAVDEEGNLGSPVARPTKPTGVADPKGPANG